MMRTACLFLALAAAAILAPVAWTADPLVQPPVPPAGQAQTVVPSLPEGTWECHGTVLLRGQEQPQRFWLRLLPPDPAFAGNRMLQLVYTPPEAAALGGTHLADAPFLLLDHDGLLVAWNDRDGMSRVTPGTGDAVYVANRDRTTSEKLDIQTDARRISGTRGWDRSVAPLLLAAAWRAGGRAQLPCVDLFGDEPAAVVSWDGAQASLAGAALTVEPDAAGRVARLVDAQGRTILTVTAWLKEGR